MVKKRYFYFLFLFFIFFSYTTAEALQIDKYNINLKKIKGEVTVTNNSNANNDIKITTDCQDLKIFPKLFSLKGGEYQLVKLFYKGSEKKLNCRIYFSEKPANEKKSDEIQENTTTAGITMVFTISIPVIIDLE